MQGFDCSVIVFLSAVIKQNTPIGFVHFLAADTQTTKLRLVVQYAQRAVHVGYHVVDHVGFATVDNVQIGKLITDFVHDVLVDVSAVVGVTRKFGCVEVLRRVVGVRNKVV